MPTACENPLTADLAHLLLYRSRFDRATLMTVRRAVAVCLSGTTLSREGVEDAVLAVGEILANVIEHGGGTGEVEVTLIDRQLELLVTDQGPGLPDEWVGRRPERVPATAVDGRGLWLAFSLCSAVDLDSSANGTRVGLLIDLPEA